MTSTPLTPVAPSSRIHAIDAVRGFALLGIFLVNIQAMGEPFGKFILPRPGAGEGPFDAAAFYLVKVFCEGKFYPLFSALFGMGVALQWERARRAGRRLVGAGIRRMLVLLGFGLAHALLLWYGDVLVLYSLAGMLLVFLVRCRVRTLVIVGSVFLAISLVLSTGLAAIISAAPDAPAAVATEPGATPAAPARFDDPFARWMEAFQKNEMNQGPSSPIWVQTETQAYREGPYKQAFMFRLCTWGFMIIIELFGFGWHIVAMFCFGAALMKAGVLTPERRGWRRKFVFLGLLVGLPASVGATLLPLAGGAGKVVATPLLVLGGPLLSLAYLGCISMLVEGGRARAVTGALARVGRMALTNYLLQSLVATTLFYFYGGGLFGETMRVGRLGIVVGVYAVQVALSAAWLSVFAFGPLEWAWRTLTYLKWQPLLRAGDTPACS